MLLNKIAPYIGANQYGDCASLNIKDYTRHCKNTYLILSVGRERCTIPLSNNIHERYELVKRIKLVINTKEEQSLNIVDNKKRFISVKFYPVILYYKNNKYYISIDVGNSTYVFLINDIEEILKSLKEYMIFPGDRFVGLEAVELIGIKEGEHLWKAKCLLCGRVNRVRRSHLVIRKSCGCLNGYQFDSDEERFYSKVDKQEDIPKELQIRGTLGLNEEPCWLWTGGKHNYGYGEFKSNRRKGGAHRYSLELKLNRRLYKNMCSCHRCNNPPCVNPNHLYEGTPKENSQDMVKSNRSIKGEDIKIHKLTNSKVLEIRDSKGKSHRQLGREYGVDKSVISDVLSYKTWKHIK